MIYATEKLPHPGSMQPGEEADVFITSENIVIHAVVINGGTHESDNYHGFEDSSDFLQEISRRPANSEEISTYKNLKNSEKQRQIEHLQKVNSFEIACDEVGVNPGYLHEIISWEGMCNEGYPAERWREKAAKKYAVDVEVINNLIKMWKP